jgi:hypothetical protein
MKKLLSNISAVTVLPNGIAFDKIVIIDGLNIYGSLNSVSVKTTNMCCDATARTTIITGLQVFTLA